MHLDRQRRLRLLEIDPSRDPPSIQYYVRPELERLKLINSHIVQVGEAGSRSQKMSDVPTKIILSAASTVRSQNN